MNKILLIAFAFLYASTALSADRISWVVPTQRLDNTLLKTSEIAGYTIYYGQTKGVYDKSVTINDSSATSHTFTDLLGGTYNFVVTTRDTGGRESKYSEVVSRTVSPPITVAKPNAPAFIFTRVGQTMTWQLELAAVTTDVDGNQITPVKYYLFDNNKWVKDVYIDKTYTFDLVAGTVHNYTMETELKTATGSIVSDRSASFIVNAEPYVIAPPNVIAPPKPPAPVVLDVPPEGVILNQPVLVTPVN